MLSLTQLLPFPDLELVRVSVGETRVHVELTPLAPHGTCPLCQHATTRVHSHYSRTVADLPWATLAVQFAITARKFFCDNPACPRKIFVERLGAAIPVYARRTWRLTAQLQELVLLSGGQTAARLAHTQHLAVSARTLLRLAHRTILPPPAAPRAIGIDDWAWRKGHRYGTLIIDLERHVPVDVLADREASSVAAWLAAHPQVEIIARDRSPLYAAGATAGAPQARQVTDRWHLVKNLVEALEKLFLRKRSVLKAAAQPPKTDGVLAEAPALNSPGGDSPKPSDPRPLPATEPLPLAAAAEAASQARHAQTVELYQRIHALQTERVAIADIAQQVGVSRVTVYRYLRMVEPPPRLRRTRSQLQRLAPYQAHLITRWNAGCRNARQLWREIAAQGYPGSERMVHHFVRRLRQDSGQARKFKSVAAAHLYAAAPAALRPLTAVQAARLLVSRKEERTDEQTQYLAGLEQADAEVATAIQLTQQFLSLVRQRGGAEFEAWLQAAEHGPVPELQRFAASLRTDYAAVQAGLTERWSNGPTEAQVGRLKMLKRAMYGRAGFTLLRQRVLYRAPEITSPRGQGVQGEPLAA
jgi:transposase